MSTMLNIQNGVRLDRLRRLADYLEFQVTDEHFGMSSWGNDSDPRATDFCGCAAGHSVALFSDEGLSLSGPAHNRLRLQLPNSPIVARGLSATQFFFGLEYFDAIYLFGYGCRNRLEEVQIIREFITKQETTP